MTTTATIPNASLDDELNVQRYLSQLRSWQAMWLDIDHRLHEQLLQLDGTKPLQLQQAAHLSNLRRRMAMTLVKEPLTIPERTLNHYGVPRIRQHLAQQFVSLTKEERLLWLNAFIVLFTHDLRQLDTKITTVRDFRTLGQTRNVLLGGESGMGKTTYLDWLIFNHLPVAEDERNHLPIIGIQAPVSNQTARPLLWRLLLECGQTYLKNDNEEILLMKLVLYFQQCGVELVVIDEIQHIVRPELRRRVLEISNMTQGLPIICAATHPIQWTAGDEEVQGRWNDVFHLQQYTGGRLDALLTTVELLLPFSQDSHLALRQVDGKPGIADLIEQWTGGILRDIMILVRDACRRAIEQSKNVSELGSQGSERCQASQKEPDGSNLDKSVTAGRQALIIASETPEADQPGKGALDFPAVLLELKTATFGLRARNDLPIDQNGFPFPFLGRLVDRFGDNLGLPTQVLCDPIEQWSAVASVRTQMTDARKPTRKLLQEPTCSLSIRQIGGMDDDGQHKALRIDEQMSFTTPDFL